MSEKGIINSALYRPLLGGLQYSKKIPPSTCKSTYLGSGDTFFSMNGIKANILKNHSQTAKIAPLLKKKTLAATVTAIYDFLYNHIQYRADESDQNLRSPACSWAVRKEGIDCKSYSIFAGCILTSLGIKYYIRKIKQPGLLPNEYTHVYIVVPKDQKKASLKSGHYVIDATKHENTEAAYIVKNDVFMDQLKHFGLQAPAGTVAMSATTIKGDFATVNNEAHKGFKEFLKFLQDVGIDNRVICKIRNTNQAYLNKGINPNWQFFDEGVCIEGEVIKYAYPEVHGQKIYNSPIDVALQASAELKGLNGKIELEKVKELGELGVELGSVIGDIFGDDGWWNNTFGAIFGNNFMLSCFNASNDPKKSGKQVAIDALAYFNASNLHDLSKGGLNTANLQKFVDMASAYIAERNFGVSNSAIAKCVREANKVGYEGMSEALYQVISTAKRLLQEHGGRLEYGPEKILKNYNFPVPSGYANGALLEDTRFVTRAKTYTVIAPNPVVITTPPVVGSGSNTNTGGGGTNTGGNTNTGGHTNTGGGNNTGGNTNTGGGTLPYVPVKTLPRVNTKGKVQQMGMSKLLVIGLIAGGLYMAHKKRNKK